MFWAEAEVGGPDNPLEHCRAILKIPEKWLFPLTPHLIGQVLNIRIIES